MSIPKTTILMLSLLSVSISVTAQDSCPTKGSGEDRIAYLSEHLDALKAESDARKHEQERWLALVRAKLKIEGKWSAKIGKDWSEEVQSSAEFKTYQSNIEHHLEQYDASLLNAFLTSDNDPEDACLHIDSTISSMRAIHAETKKQFELMNAAMLARQAQAPGNALPESKAPF